MVNYSERFIADQPDPTFKIWEIADWSQQVEISQLLLPPIQRSIVWSNEQVINYWDSLLRGYPAGMMIVHRKGIGEGEENSMGRDSEGKTRQAGENDFRLFDGQQRLTTILLGFGLGQMRGNHRLWVDIGKEPKKNSGLKFQLRISSTGQPFGYKPDFPNQKIELSERVKKWEEWEKSPGKKSSRISTPEVFKVATGKYIIDSECSIAFDEIYERLSKLGADPTVEEFSKRPGAQFDILERFVKSLERALNSNIILQQMGTEIVENPDEYIRFFGRLGQGGTRLSDDELSYSIIKHHYPEIHDRMEGIMKGQVGRLAGEVDLVLAALRIAKTLSPWESAKEWEVISRPSPLFVSQLKDKERDAVRQKFLEIIGWRRKTSKLEEALMKVRTTLSFDDTLSIKTPDGGLPNILLASLPRELVDVLLLFTLKGGENQLILENGRKTLRAFVMYWLLFIGDDAKAAWHTFLRAKDVKWSFSQDNIQKLISEFEADGISYFLPRQKTLEKLLSEVQKVGKNDHLLRQWSERFTACDAEGEKKPGEALRVLSTNVKLIKRAMMWLQRVYISREFPNFDPTSDRDEDLPIDLDHIIPYDLFGFDWRKRDKRLDLKNFPDFDSENFYWGRGVVGNSIGNFRWLDARENRGRGKSAYVPLEQNADLVEKPNEWNKLIPEGNAKQCWSKEDLTSFQRLIDLRTLKLYENLLVESGIIEILPVL